MKCYAIPYRVLLPHRRAIELLHGLFMIITQRQSEEREENEGVDQMHPIRDYVKMDSSKNYSKTREKAEADIWMESE